jgi:copper chaperone
MTTAVYDVDGMTCSHCLSAVSAEIAKLADVRDIAVDLEMGKVTVTADLPLHEDDVRAAIDKAGYTLMAASVIEP